jgi:hypothetical protein
MISIHNLTCVPNISKTIQFANRKKINNMARSSSSITFKDAVTKVASDSLIANHGDVVKTSMETITANKSSSSSFSRIQTQLKQFPELPVNYDPNATNAPLIIPDEFIRKARNIDAGSEVFLRLNTIVDGKRVLVFFTDLMLKHMTKSITISFDGTFKVPEQDGFLQLFIVGATIVCFNSSKVYPIAYAMCGGKSQPIYTAVFQSILDATRQLQEVDNSIYVKMLGSMSDFELAMRNALDDLLGGNAYHRNFLRTERITVLHSGCIFHLSRALLRKLQELGLKKFYSHLDIGLLAFVKKLTALAFLSPGDVSSVYLQLLTPTHLPTFTVGSPEATSFSQFLTYYQITWLGWPYAQGVFVSQVANPLKLAQWSIMGLDRRTNNDLEGLNSKMASDLNRTKSHLWKYLENLQIFNMMNEISISQFTAPGYKAPKPSGKMVKREAEIERLAQKHFVDKDLDGLSFVTAMSRLVTGDK